MKIKNTLDKLAKFFMAGIGLLVYKIIATSFLTSLGLSLALSYMMVIFTSIAIGFFINFCFTFKNKTKAGEKAWMYVGAAGLFYFLDWAGVNMIASKMNTTITIVFVTGCIFLVKFYIYNYHLFIEKEGDKDDKEHRRELL